MKLHRLSWIRSLTERLSLFKKDASITSMVRISHGGTWGRIRQEKLAPDGVEYLEDKSLATTQAVKALYDDHSHDVVYVHPPRPTKKWTTATGDVDGDTAHVEAIMTHELGHVAGLGHAKTSALMKGGFNPDILGIKLYDRQAMRLIYKVHTSH